MITVDELTRLDALSGNWPEEISELITIARAVLAWREKVHADNWSAGAKAVADACYLGKCPGDIYGREPK